LPVGLKAVQLKLLRMMSVLECAAAALPLRCRCAAAALPLRCRCAAAALPLSSLDDTILSGYFIGVNLRVVV